MFGLLKRKTVVEKPAPARVRHQARYLRGDQSGILSMRRAITRDSSTDVREAAGRASALAFDFLHNSGWIAGAADQIVSDVIGVELSLSCRADLSAAGYDQKEQSEFARLVEKEWRYWAWDPAECDLAGVMNVPEMLDAAVRSYVATGEAFGVMDYLTVRQRRGYGIRTGTKVSLVASHRCQRKTNTIEGLDQGIYHDEFSRPISYLFLENASGIEQDKIVPARDVIHVMDRGEHAHSPRGITLLAPILKVIAQSDQLADATLATALLQASFAATIKSPEPSREAFEAIQTLADTGVPDGYEQEDWDNMIGGVSADLVEIWDQRFAALRENGISLNDPARVGSLGPGDEFEMHTAKTPGPQYVPFSQNLQREMARCLGITFENFAMDHSNANYSSVRMATSSIWPIVEKRRERIAGPFIQAIYERWLDEIIWTGRIPFKGGYSAFAAQRDRAVWTEWQGPAQPTADDYRAAMATKVRLETGVSSLQDETAIYGRDWEDVANQREKEKDVLEEKGLPVPFQPMTGGAGPLGAATDGQREKESA